LESDPAYYLTDPVHSFPVEKIIDSRTTGLGQCLSFVFVFWFIRIYGCMLSLVRAS
jgi:hypothetical protein